MSLILEIVTPENKVYSDRADSIVVPTVEGELGILPGHIPILAALKPGELVVSSGRGTEHLAIDKGFAQVLGDKVSILTDGAISIEEIDLAAVEKARLRAEKALAEAETSTIDPTELEKLETIVRFSVAQKLAKQKRL